MQAIIKIFILSFILIFPFSYTLALKIDVPKQNLYMKIYGKYGTEWVKLFQDKKTWVCQNESFPYIELKENPIKNIDWKMFSNKKNKDNCRDFVAIYNNLSKTPKTYTGCKTDENISDFIKALYKSCRI